MSFLDREKDVIEWSSEEFFIPYRCRTDGKMHRYFPDFKIKVRDKNGKIKTQVIEIKPHGQCVRPTLPTKETKKSRQRYLSEAMTYAKNRSKWDYAKKWCADRNYQFRIITEKHLPGVFEHNINR